MALKRPVVTIDRKVEYKTQKGIETQGGPERNVAWRDKQEPGTSEDRRRAKPSAPEKPQRQLNYTSEGYV